MPSIDLPRALRDYFAFAETTPTRNGRRFSITLPYIAASGQLDRLQWWYHLSSAREQVMGESAVETLRAQAIERFLSHIDQWLGSTGQALYGEGPIPQLGPADARAATPRPAETDTADESLEPPAEKKAYG